MGRRLNAEHHVDWLTTLGYSPDMDAGAAFTRLVEIMASLRGPNGCPWDRDQTHESIKPYLIKETYEVVEAIERQDDSEFCTELGDVLLQIVFHAQMASEEGRFTVTDVIEAINEKLVRRHPHVFGDGEVRNADDVVRSWVRIKAEEKRTRTIVPLLPAFLVQCRPSCARTDWKKAANSGFDWENVRGVLNKVREEIAELEEAIEGGSNQAIEMELGDLLFATTSVARHLDVNPKTRSGARATVSPNDSAR